MGTPSYMAPEAAWGESAQADVRGDIFSLGSVLYLALTGVEPFPGNNIAAVIHAVVNTEPDPVSRRNSALPEEVSRVVERAMAKDPAQRFSSMAELAAALGEAAGEPVGPDPCSWAVETVLEDHGGEAPVMKNTDLADTRPSAAESGGTAVTLLEGQPSAERPPLADPDIRSRIGRLSGVALVLILLLGGGGLLWLVLGEKDTPTVSDLASRDGLTGVRDSGPGLEPSASGPLKQSLGTISGEVIGCYTEAIKGRAQLQGKLRFKLVFGDGGELKDVSPVEDSVGSPALAACIVTQLKKLPRQPTMAGKVVRVPYQFATARKVALLPFENLAHADELDWLRGGMVESLSAKLGQISSVVLVDRAKLRAGLAGSGQKGGQEQGIHAAHEAGATLVIMGAFQRFGGQVRLTARLARTTDGHVMATAEATGPLEQIFSLQDQLTQKLARAMKLDGVPGADQALAVRTGGSLAILRLLGTANNALEQSQDPASIPRAEALFRQVIDMAKDIPETYLGLVRTLWHRREPGRKDAPRLLRSDQPVRLPPLERRQLRRGLQHAAPGPAPETLFRCRLLWTGPRLRQQRQGGRGPGHAAASVEPGPRRFRVPHSARLIHLRVQAGPCPSPQTHDPRPGSAGGRLLEPHHAGLRAAHGGRRDELSQDPVPKPHKRPSQQGSCHAEYCDGGGM